MKFIISFLMLLFLSNSFSGEHKLSTITGKGVQLSTEGHAIAGQVAGHLIFGVATGEHHDKSTLLIHDDEVVLKTTFSDVEGEWGGTINDEKKKSVFKFKSFDSERNVFIITYNEKEFEVKVGFDKYEDNHFINPSYALDYYGKTLKIKMKEGAACKKYSLHLIFMIFGTFLHSL